MTLRIDWQPVGEFFVLGEPKAQPRPRGRVMLLRPWPAVRAASSVKALMGMLTVRMYTPESADDWRASVLAVAKAARPTAALTGPVRVDITAYLPRPARRMRRADPYGEVLHTAKPDRDNLDKLILDAMTTAGWWVDDSQVCAGETLKCYHAKTGHPGAWVRVSSAVGLHVVARSVDDVASALDGV